MDLPDDEDLITAPQGRVRLIKYNLDHDNDDLPDHIQARLDRIRDNSLQKYRETRYNRDK